MRPVILVLGTISVFVVTVCVGLCPGGDEGNPYQEGWQWYGHAQCDECVKIVSMLLNDENDKEFQKAVRDILRLSREEKYDDAKKVVEDMSDNFKAHLSADYFTGVCAPYKTYYGL